MQLYIKETLLKILNSSQETERAAHQHTPSVAASGLKLGYVERTLPDVRVTHGICA